MDQNSISAKRATHLAVQFKRAHTDLIAVEAVFECSDEDPVLPARVRANLAGQNRRVKARALQLRNRFEQADRLQRDRRAAGCRCPRKRGWDCPEAALHALRQAREVHLDQQRNKVEQRAYLCRCGLWHLTHQPGLSIPGRALNASDPLGAHTGNDRA